MNMEEKKIIYDIILSVWNIVKTYFFQRMSDDDIENMWNQAKTEEKRFKECGENYNLLFRGIWSAFVQYYERKKS